MNHCTKQFFFTDAFSPQGVHIQENKSLIKSPASVLQACFQNGALFQSPSSWFRAILQTANFKTPALIQRLAKKHLSRWIKRLTSTAGVLERSTVNC